MRTRCTMKISILFEKFLDDVVTELLNTEAENFRELIAEKDKEKLSAILQALQLMIAMAFIADTNPKEVAISIEYILWEEVKSDFYDTDIVH